MNFGLLFRRLQRPTHDSLATKEKTGVN